MSAASGSLLASLEEGVVDVGEDSSIADRGGCEKLVDLLVASDSESKHSRGDPGLCGARLSGFHGLLDVHSEVEDLLCDILENARHEDSGAL